MKNDRISMSVIRRLPRYYRFLSELNANSIKRISSSELASRMGLTASQIRQDLNCFGGFGQQGYGYSVEQLYESFGNILGIHNCYPTVLIGAGNLGRAVASHISFESKGFKLVGIFDNNPQLIGTKLKGIEIQSSDNLVDFCKENIPKVAILCLPRDSGENVAEKLINEVGIKCFWNFSHYDITLKHKDVIMENVHMSDSLMTLCYRITDEERAKNATDETE